MNKQEIISAINSRVSQQGNQSGLGGLDEILHSILERTDDLNRPFLSINKLRKYLYQITFDKLVADTGLNTLVCGACSAYVQNGKLYRNFDFHFDNTASFIVKTNTFEGMAYMPGLNDGELKEELIAQLPYRMVDGINVYGIKVSVHLLFNDWSWKSVGDKNIPITSLPAIVLSRVKSMETIEADLAGILNNLTSTPGMGDYLLQMLVTDGATTYAIIPPDADNSAYTLVNASDNPKMTNFRYVSRSEVSRNDMDIQERPTGIERFNLMPCPLENLRFTLAYESADRLSEFIGIQETTKASTDEELEAIYNLARAKYLNRSRDGETWHTMHSVVYSARMESLFIQEDWEDNCIDLADAINLIGDLADLDTDHKSNLVEAINELAGIIETTELVVDMAQSHAERKAIYELCELHPQLAKNIVFYVPDDNLYYGVNGYNFANDLLTLHVIMKDGANLRHSTFQIASNGSIAVI